MKMLARYEDKRQKRVENDDGEEKKKFLLHCKLSSAENYSIIYPERTRTISDARNTEWLNMLCFAVSESTCCL